MRKALHILVPLAAAAVPLAMATAAHAEGTSYQATLDPLNHSGGSGMATVTLTGNTADIDVSWSGLASTFGGNPYPHVQHIHIGGQGTCPTPAADTNGDGVISTTEGGPAYGGIGTTLSVKGDTSPAAGTNIKIAPSGDSTDYHRTITLDDKTLASLKSGTGVVVVHGLDPATLSKQAQNEKSDLVKSLPLAATSPALCGALTAMPAGGVAAGAGTTAGIEDAGLLAAGGGLVAGAAGLALYAVRRRQAAEA
ncbi:CHRD domain-containing protein [Nocardioides panaciterrulae]|uniref:CHRD domain-containing protein n=1 Tax=Nocardioides panaciterrulae TaxID=661492 RepID=A0A7Y9E834_9ACTN|nr:hypothetical protein [Nocardioides panaciterrulae]NYD42843.1 hypothetical protein [Nocardioides panaciterrulae]